MTAARLVVLRAPALAEPVEQDALVALAQRLAAELQATLDVVELQTGGAAADTGAAAGGAAAQAGNADAAAWWRVRHAQAGSDEAPVLAALCDAALAALPAPAARTVVLLPAGSLGVELAAALAARREGVSFGRSESLAREGTALVARRLVFGGRAEAAVRSEAAWCFAALRGAGEHAAAAPAPPVRTLAIAPALPPSWTRAPLPSGALRRPARSAVSARCCNASASDAGHSRSATGPRSNALSAASNASATATISHRRRRGQRANRSNTTAKTRAGVTPVAPRPRPADCRSARAGG